MPSSSPPPSELHLLYVLLDSNLPTGGFVSSSGLESYAKHGFLLSHPSKNGLIEFARAEIGNYGFMTLGFVSDAWKSFNVAGTAKTEDGVLRDITELDRYHENTSLSHVARRSSKAQGVAMLTLYVRGLHDPNDDTLRNVRGKRIIDEYKRLIRKGDTPGHLAVCWGVVSAALGLSLERAMHLHLFLHARSLLSSAVRLNLIGPYLSSQLLLYPLEPLINESLKMEHTTGILDIAEKDVSVKDTWDWADEAEMGPATTWPLGEVLMGRHDMQHSRIFNS